MSRRVRYRRILLCAVLASVTFASAEDTQQQKLDRQFQSAVAQYNAGQYAQAATQLEVLLPLVPNNFQVEELLGLSYSSLSQDAKAIEHLEAAVRLKPDSGSARTNLAASLSHSGDTELAGEQFRKALELEPNDYTANHNLGEFYAQSGKVSDARPFLRHAQQIRPSSYGNGYDLAMADFMTGHLDEARQTVESMLQRKNTGELHNMLAQIDEKDGKYVDAANEFGTAAHLDPSEDNLFDWGCELLLHRTYEPAIEVFRQATLRYPASARLQIGLGIALYSRGIYEKAVNALLAAVDLDPSDPRCYLFLSKAYNSSPGEADEVIQRFRRYAELEPRNALAQYYYAMSLWKGKRDEGSGLDVQTIESLLTKSTALDGDLSETHMQLGNLYAEQHQYDKSISEYVRTLDLNPNLPDAHYRLGTDYVHVGQKDLARKEFDIYEKLRSQHLAEMDKETSAVQQFVYSSKDVHPTGP